jgi:hypothetical protein
MDARSLPTCVNPSCLQTRPGISNLQADPSGTLADIALALSLGTAAGVLIWLHASDRRGWQLGIMTILIPLCGMAFVLFAFTTLSWTAITIGVVMLPAVLGGSVNQRLGRAPTLPLAAGMDQTVRGP